MITGKEQDKTLRLLSIRGFLGVRYGGYKKYRGDLDDNCRRLYLEGSTNGYGQLKSAFWYLAFLVYIWRIGIPVLLAFGCTTPRQHPSHGIAPSVSLDESDLPFSRDTHDYRRIGILYFGNNNEVEDCAGLWGSWTIQFLSLQFTPNAEAI